MSWLIRGVLIIAIAALAAWASFYLSGTLNIPETFRKLSSELSIESIRQQIIAPPPLRATREYDISVLTKAGVISWTNTRRANNGGLPPLTENALLDAAALKKAQDMFAKQYFAHVSPAGVDAGELVLNAGYDYILVGENLALGNFADDQDLVRGWMDSPGHRANILNTRFTEIGVAVVRGTYEGRTVWMAVQEFGLPRSACPSPDKALLGKIEMDRSLIDEYQKTLDQKSGELENTRPKSGSEYNQKVDEYNALVEEYNKLVQAAKALISQYNTQVDAANTCAEG